MHLIICIGNEARGDDGAARHVARALIGVPGISVLSAPQLDVLMAEEIAGASRVTFVDAERRSEPPVRLAPVAPAAVVAGSTSHALDPPALLALARALYGAAPAAELVTLAAPSMDHSQDLSRTAADAVLEAVRLLVPGDCG